MIEKRNNINSSPNQIHIQGHKHVDIVTIVLMCGSTKNNKNNDYVHINQLSIGIRHSIC